MPRRPSRETKLEKRRFLKYILTLCFGSKCQACGQSFHPDIYQFHHYGDEKDGEISDMLSSSNVKSILKEVAKTTMLCPNCHAQHHLGFLVLKDVKMLSYGELKTRFLSYIEEGLDFGYLKYRNLKRAITTWKLCD